MTSSAFLAVFTKEVRLLARDIHGLALLFILPLVFILIMSLALQNLFDARAGKGLGVLVLNQDRGELSETLVQRLSDNAAFAVHDADATASPETLPRLLNEGPYAFAVHISPDYSQNLKKQTSETDAPPLVTILVAPQTTRQTELVFTAALREALARQRAVELWGVYVEPILSASTDPIAVEYAYRRGDNRETPTAVQQNTPGWLVFAMFFIAVPFSNSFIRERQFGVLRRLRTTNIGPLAQFFGKLAPYFLINQIQVVLMLATGALLVPRLGGDALAINGGPLGLVVLAAALSFAALALALLIAVTARTTEQATMLAGIGVIVLGAVGGVMVPTFVMPAALQNIAQFSPMAWGVEGFLDLFLRGGGLAEVLSEVLKLLCFGAVALSLAFLLHRVHEQKG